MTKMVLFNGFCEQTNRNADGLGLITKNNL